MVDVSCDIPADLLAANPENVDETGDWLPRRNPAEGFERGSSELAAQS
jgi:hypothetical protein